MMQELEVEPNPEEASFPHLQVDVVYEDEAMVVLNKPSGLLSIPGKQEHYSVATIAQERWPGSILVHRLDMGTSGLLVVAKTKEAYRCLQEQFVKHTVRKRYIALLDGILPDTAPKGTIRLPLLSDPMNRPCQVVDYERGKTAVTEYEVLQIKDGKTLVALYPHTGRTHQLRVHCAHEEGLGCPIVGDELYGKKDVNDKSLGEKESGRLCLHSDRLELTHPVSGALLRFEQPCPFL
jgi:tRNA pseudouridine32 synthase/23S rRNA pseudouridine746 synthase